MGKFKISLEAARVNANLTQEAVSRVMSVSRNTIINWEKGRTKVNKAELKMLSNLYDVPIDNIFLPNQST